MNPFAYLRATYGNETLSLINKFIDHSVASARYQQHATFGHRCKAHRLLPNGFRIKPPTRSVAGYVLAEKCGHLFLRQWIGKCHAKIKSERTLAENIRSQLGDILSDNDLMLVVNIATGKTERISASLRSNQIAKFEALRRDAQLKAKNRRPKQRADLILNLSSKQLTEDESSVLSRGLNFVPTNPRVPVKDLLLKVQCATSHLRPADAEEVRQEVANAVTRYKPNGRSNLTWGERKAIRNLRDDKDIVILPADKGRKTVILDVTDYNSKVMDLLSDASTYQLINRDPTPSTEMELNRMLRKLLNDDKISDAQYKHLRSSGGQTPRFYGLPKVHKPGIPLRPIVSCILAPTYNTSRHLADILAPIALNNPRRARNGEEVVKLVAGTVLEDDEEMVSFDVVALFTSIPTDLACRITLEKLSQDDELHHRSCLTPEDIATLLRFCLDSTFFTFSGQCYKQVFGTAMGSPVSATVADIVMQHIEETALSTFLYDVRLWKRYVDDILAFLKRHHTRMLLDHLNTIDQHIQFTLEQETDGHLSFLDIRLSRLPGGAITSTVHRKPTHTDSYLHFESDHPPRHKAAVVKTLLGRIPTHVTNDTDKREEEQHVINALVNCGYKTDFIERNRPTPPPVIIEEVTENNDGENTDRIFRTPIPYVPGLSQQVSRILRRFDINTTFVPGNSLRDFLVHPKDSVPTILQSNVVYSVPCKDCGKPYIGETLRRLGDRLKEHRRAVREADLHNSALAEHVWSGHHAVDWEGTTILDKARNWRERKYREAIAIACEPSNINRDKGLELPVQFLNIIKSTRSSST